MKLLIFLLCCVCTYGDDSQIDIPFNISIIHGDTARCEQTDEVIVKEGQNVKLYANVPDAEGIYRAICEYNNGTGFRELHEEYYKPNANDAWFLIVKKIKDKFGDWRCRLGFNKNNKLGLQNVDGECTFVNCTVRVQGEEESETPRSLDTKMDVQTIAIFSGVGILVLVVIIAQTIALCYFKRKAQPRRRMDTMPTRTRFDRGDTARYSAPPCRKGSKGNARAQADTDSHIYEMVGINALYKESKELNQEGTTDATERVIKNRPPLPLPHEIPDAVPHDTLPRPNPSPLKSTLSTMSLISNNSTLNKKKGKELPPQPVQGLKKAPARPPKQIEEDMPGSLKRPPKTSPSLALVPKTGSIPKMPASDPAMLELKNIFKNRNIGNVSDSPAPSPTSTLEKKPKIQAKPNKKQPTQEPKPTPPKPIGGINPLAPPGPSQIRLILPKIEASLKSPKTVPTQNVKPIPEPLKKPILPTPMPQPKPTLQMSHPTPKYQPAPMSQPTPMSPPLSRPMPAVPHLAQPTVPVAHMSPLQNRPLPAPNEAPTSRPLPPDPMPDDIYQMPDDDESPHTDDDEEWTYEQLGQYNLYNI